MAFSGLLNKTCTIQTVTRAKDQYGSSDETVTNTATNVPCRMQPMSGREQSIYSSDRAVATHKMFCETDVAITEDNRIVFNGSSFDVEFVKNVDFMDHHYELELREIRSNI